MGDIRCVYIQCNINQGKWITIEKLLQLVGEREREREREKKWSH